MAWPPGDERPPPLRRCRQALVSKLVECFGDGRPAHCQVGGEPTLWRQAPPGRKHAGLDCQAQGVRQPAGQRAVADG